MSFPNYDVVSILIEIEICQTAIANKCSVNK